MIVVGALFALMGGAMLVYVAVAHIAPLCWAYTVLVEQRCVLVDKRLVERRGSEGPEYRLEFLIRYESAGQVHEVLDS